MNKKIKTYIIFIFVAFFAVLQIIISNHLSTYGDAINKLSKQTDNLVLENVRVNKKIASASAIVNLTEKAKELGFIKKANIIYVEDLYSVAQK